MSVDENRRNSDSSPLRLITSVTFEQSPFTLVSTNLHFMFQKREIVKQLACGKFAVAALEVAAVKV